MLANATPARRPRVATDLGRPPPPNTQTSNGTFGINSPMFLKPSSSRIYISRLKRAKKTNGPTTDRRKRDAPMLWDGPGRSGRGKILEKNQRRQLLSHIFSNGLFLKKFLQIHLETEVTAASKPLSNRTRSRLWMYGI